MFVPHYQMQFMHVSYHNLNGNSPVQNVISQNYNKIAGKPKVVIKHKYTKTAVSDGK